MDNYREKPKEGKPFYNDNNGEKRDFGGERKDYRGGRNEFNKNPKFSRPMSGKPPAKNTGREKTETQPFISLGEEKIETLFPVPVSVRLPNFQRSVGMAEGIIVEANEKGNGTVEIDGIKYPLKENRDEKIQKRYPLSRYVGKSIKFSFYPTITTKGIKILKLEPTSPPFIKISNFRKEITKQGAVEVLGTVKAIDKTFFVVSIWSASSKKEYVVTVFGDCTAKLGEFVKVDCILKDGVIKAEVISVLNVPKREYNSRY